MRDEALPLLKMLQCSRGEGGRGGGGSTEKFQIMSKRVFDFWFYRVVEGMEDEDGGFKAKTKMQKINHTDVPCLLKPMCTHTSILLDP